jgi:hypothetical protein
VREFSYYTERIDGVELEKPLPDKRHAVIQNYLLVLFAQTLPWPYRALPELTVVCGQDRLVPNIVVLHRNARFTAGELADPPILAVAIAAPGQTLPALLDKGGRLAGTLELTCWIILPEQRKALRLLGIPGSKVPSVMQDAAIALKADLSPYQRLTVPVADLWNALEE